MDAAAAWAPNQADGQGNVALETAQQLCDSEIVI